MPEPLPYQLMLGQEELLMYQRFLRDTMQTQGSTRPPLSEDGYTVLSRLAALVAELTRQAVMTHGICAIASSEDLARFAMEASLTPELLDDAVHDAFAQRASAINNGGVGDQIHTLVTENGLEDTLQRVRDAITEQRTATPLEAP